MIAVETNILIHSVREESPYYRPALTQTTSLAESRDPWAIPWPCVYEFLRVVTHPKLFSQPNTKEDALERIERFRESAATGNLVHEHIAALCLGHGVSEFYTMDREFSRFTELRVVYPFRNRA